MCPILIESDTIIKGGIAAYPSRLVENDLMRWGLISLMVATLAACGAGEQEEPIVTAHEGRLSTPCGMTGVGLRESQDYLDAEEKRLVWAFGPVYGGEDVVCKALAGVTIYILPDQDEIEPGVFGAYTPETRVMRLPNRYLNEGAFAHEAGHALQWTILSKPGHDGWDKAQGVHWAIHRFWCSFYGSIYPEQCSAT
jgi:hypothetical protein